MLKPIGKNILCEIVEEKKKIIVVEEDVTKKHLKVVSIGQEVAEIQIGERIWLKPKTILTQIKIKDKELIVVNSDNVLCVE